jgi:superfamily II DNA or RNA helicase
LEAHSIDLTLFGPRETPHRPLRSYQAECLDAWERSTHRGVLCVLATGLGKTRIAGEICRRTNGRVLFVVNRTNLGQQSIASLQEDTGQRWELEQADEWASVRGKANVVTLVQTLMQPRRFERFGRDGFALIIVDEVHKMMAPRYRRPMEFFSGARILGLTATPAEKNYQPLFTETCFHYPLAKALVNSWSTPLDFQPYQVDIDLGGVKWDRGDFVVGQLDEAIASAAAVVGRAAIEKCGDLCTMVFCPGVKAVVAATDAINGLKPGSARAYYGELDGRDGQGTKARNLADFKAGRYQYIVSCNALMEGADFPRVQCLLIARPMGKRHDFEQVVGRGSRLWPGVGDIEDVTERRAAIAASPKPHCRVIDLACVSLEHELVGPVDVLGGDYTDKERALAKAKLRQSGGGDPLDALDRARVELARKAAMAKAAQEARIKFKLLRGGVSVVTPGMKASLEGYGISPAGLSYEDALKALRKEKFAEKRGWVVFKTRQGLERLVGVRNAWGMPVEAAKALREAWIAGGKARMSEQKIREVLGK